MSFSNPFGGLHWPIEIISVNYERLGILSFLSLRGSVVSSVRRGKNGNSGKKVVLTANTGFSIFHFRLSLLKYLQSKKWEVVAIACDERNYKDSFLAEGIRFINLPIDHKGKNPIKDLLFLLRLFRIYLKESPDVVHHFTIKPVIFGSLAAKLAGTDGVVNTITGLGYAFETGGRLNYLVKTLYSIALSGKPRVIFQNADNYKLFLEKGIVNKKQSSVILGSGVDTSVLLPVKPTNQTNNLLFLMVSRMLWSKGVQEFVSAADKVKQSYPNVRFIMVGGISGGGAEGNPQAVPEKWLLKVNQGNAVKWMDRVPFPEVLKLMDRAQVIVLPSYAEGVPRSLLEGASKGKPIITTDAPGCREVVDDGINGFLIPAGDSERLAECMIAFVSRPELINLMGIASRKKAEKLFDEKIVFEKTLNIYAGSAEIEPNRVTENNGK